MNVNPVLVVIGGILAASSDISAGASVSPARQAPVISLAGAWTFRLDPQDVGKREAWADEAFTDPISLPGSTDENGYGHKTTEVERDRLSRPYEYRGAAWYQRTVVIPDDWSGKRIRLFLERCHWATEVWIDGVAVGTGDSLSVPHVYDLTPVCSAGKHTLTIRVDNRVRVKVGHGAHSVTDWTQTNWNGIVGRIELQAHDSVWIGDLQVYPNVENHSVEVKTTISNATDKAVNGELVITALGAHNGRRHAVRKQQLPFRIEGESTALALTCELGPETMLWDMDHPALYTLTAVIEANTEAKAFRDERQVTFGMRSIATRGTQFLLNGRPFFLRGTLECCIFPRTGYPDMQGDRWRHIMAVAKEYGLNHLRFHSWCPPSAAFEAADEAGITLQVELPVWSNDVGKDAELNAYMAAEGKRILQTYGNHPSFTMLCLGNELAGDWEFMDRLVGEMKGSDARRLYTFSADYRRKRPGPVSDFYVSHTTEGGRLRIYGERMFTPPTTDCDYSDKVALYSVPLVAHELGQWSVYPDYREIPKYTGVLKPRNLKAFRDSLDEHGMLEIRHRFHQASGRFSWLVYKEDIETTLRTPSFGGFQLLDLHDFPGQGTALVGLLDVFWDSKGILSPEQFRQFCAPTVVLLRMKSFTWTTDQTWSGRVQVAHYGHADLNDQSARWVIRDNRGRELGRGQLAPRDLPVGQVTTLGDIELPLKGLDDAAQCRVEVTLGANGVKNGWDFWVYPADCDTEPPQGVLVACEFDEDTRAALAAGGNVLLIKTDGPTMQKMDFFPVFWQFNGFSNRREGRGGGILCDPEAPALAAFPTDFHSNWQWYDLTRRSHCFDLDATDPAFEPVVWFIDDFHRNLKLGVLFETRVGRGKLLACSLDLKGDLNRRPVARQMLRGLYHYMASPAFRPQAAVKTDVLSQILK